MKKLRLFRMAFMLVGVLFAAGSVAEDYIRFSLPGGAVARLGKGSIGEVAYSRPTAAGVEGGFPTCLRRSGQDPRPTTLHVAPQARGFPAGSGALKLDLDLPHGSAGGGARNSTGEIR